MPSQSLQATYPSTFPTSRSFSFTRLYQTNHQTNTRLSKLLTYWRDCHRPTFHAKRRAERLNLRVDTDLAVRLNYWKVSDKPLPVLVPETPVEEKEVVAEKEVRMRIPRSQAAEIVYPGHATIQLEEADPEQTMPIDACDDQDADEEGYSSSSSASSSSSFGYFDEDDTQAQQETYVPQPPAVPTPEKRSTRPLLRCIIPAAVQAPIERSYFSSDSEYSQVSSVNLHSPSPIVDKVLPSGRRRASVMQAASPAPSGERKLSIILPAPQAIYPNRGRLIVPEDISRPMSWGCGEVITSTSTSTSSSSDTSSSPTSSSSSSGHSRSSSSSDSSSLYTPSDLAPIPHRSPYMLRFKRKSAVMDKDSEMSPSSDEVFEKRPKFERKHWLDLSGVVSGGQPIARPSAPAPTQLLPMGRGSGYGKRYASAPSRFPDA